MEQQSAAARPWTAEIASPFDGKKSKYNIATSAEVHTAEVMKTTSIKQRKEQCTPPPPNVHWLGENHGAHDFQMPPQRKSSRTVSHA